MRLYGTIATTPHYWEVVCVLEHGTDLNARDHSNWTPLFGASQEGHLEVVQFLLNYGVDSQATDHGGWTSL
jgi:ankyrin repeat protein